MSFLNSFRVRFFLGAAIVIMLVAVNLRGGPAKSSLQAQYEIWLMQKEPELSAPANPEAPDPGISLRLISREKGQEGDYRLAGTAGDRQKLLRLLQLVREANLFSLSKWKTGMENWPGISLMISEGERTFRTQFSFEDVEDNLPARNLLKLLQIYSLPPSAAAGTAAAELEPAPKDPNKATE